MIDPIQIEAAKKDLKEICEYKKTPFSLSLKSSKTSTRCSLFVTGLGFILLGAAGKVFPSIAVGGAFLAFLIVAA